MIVFLKYFWKSILLITFTQNSYTQSNETLIMKATHLKVGDPAPEFHALNELNEVCSLSQFKGKKVVLYFYPKDDTPGCTAEACSLRDNYHKFLHEGYVVLGVSPDSVAKHKKFIAKYQLPFHLLADTDHSISEAFGVWGEKKFMGRTYMGVIRTTFLVDEKGMIQHIWTDVNTEAHADQIFDSVTK